MQRSTGKELAIRKDEIRERLERAIAHHENCTAARASVGNWQQQALWHGWLTGIELNGLKALVPSGDWEDWLELNFCKPCDVGRSTAYLYMKIDKDNAELRPKVQRVGQGKIDFQLLTRLRFDTVRKYAIGFVPEKKQIKHKHNVKLEKHVSFLNIVNEYEKLKQRHIHGLQLVDFEEVREETGELLAFLLWVHNRSETNPWNAPR